MNVDTASSPPSVRAPRVRRAVLALTLLTIAASLALGGLGGAAATDATDGGPLIFGLLAVVTLGLGIPHGAVDHLVAADVFSLGMTVRDQALFYGAYLALMAVYAALWVVWPVGCLAFFLLMAVYHFGQADLEYLGARGVWRVLLNCSRGLLVIGLPVVAHPEVVAAIFASIAGAEMVPVAAVQQYESALIAALVAQHAGLLVATSRRRSDGALRRELLNTAVLAGLFVFARPLVALAVYFGLWHSLGHILELSRFLKRTGRPATLGAFYRAAAPLTLLATLGLVALYALAQAFGAREAMVALLFIFISVVTLPHMLLVERFYQQQHERAQRERKKAASALQ